MRRITNDPVLRLCARALRATYAHGCQGNESSRPVDRTAPGRILVRDVSAKKERTRRRFVTRRHLRDAAGTAPAIAFSGPEIESNLGILDRKIDALYVRVPEGTLGPTKNQAIQRSTRTILRTENIPRKRPCTPLPAGRRADPAIDKDRRAATSTGRPMGFPFRMALLRYC